jgi:class 3 adenylate cyclase
MDQGQAMELAAQVAAAYASPLDRLQMAVYRRQQELVWMEQLVERIESELEAAGHSVDPKGLPAMCFVDLVGYTRLTEERGDQAAAELAQSLRVIVARAAREHGGSPVKWLGDGAMVHFRTPRGAVEFALHTVAWIPNSGLPPAHVGVASEPLVAHGGDYFGRTVNLAARIATRARPAKCS